TTCDAHPSPRERRAGDVPMPISFELATNQKPAARARKPEPPKRPGASWTYSFAKRPSAPASFEDAMRAPSSVLAIEPPNQIAPGTITRKARTSGVMRAPSSRAGRRRPCSLKSCAARPREPHLALVPTTTAPLPEGDGAVAASGDSDETEAADRLALLGELGHR